MGDNREHRPPVHCAVCLQLGEQTPSTATVVTRFGNYQACDPHADDITLNGFDAAIQHAKRNRTKGAV